LRGAGPASAAPRRRGGASEGLGLEDLGHDHDGRRDLAQGESAIKYKSPLHVPKDTYDHSCY
jgi:hypothetical protein